MLVLEYKYTPVLDASWCLTPLCRSPSSRDTYDTQLQPFGTVCRPHGLAVLGAARLSGLGAARLLAPPSPTMRKAVMGAAIFSCLGTARLLTPSTAAMCHAVVGGALSCLGTSRLLTPSASTMPLAVTRAP